LARIKPLLPLAAVWGQITGFLPLRVQDLAVDAGAAGGGLRDDLHQALKVGVGQGGHFGFSVYVRKAHSRFSRNLDYSVCLIKILHVILSLKLYYFLNSII